MAGPGETSGLFLFDEPQAGAPRRSLEMRNNFEALARTNIGSDPTKPSAPREGMLRILKDPSPANNWRLQSFLSGAWQTLLQRINGGLPAPAKLIFNFTSPVSPWVIQHNLGSYPLIQILNASFIQRQPVPFAPGPDQFILQHADVNRAIVTFSGPMTGLAIVLG